MMTRLIPFAVLGLIACAPTDDPRLGRTGGEQFAKAMTEVTRDTPFRDGPIRVVATDPDPVRIVQTFALVPCRDGANICGGSDLGPAGSLSIVDGRAVVTGAYPGRTFHLAKGGAGFIDTAGVIVPLAWD